MSMSHNLYLVHGQYSLTCTSSTVNILDTNLIALSMTPSWDKESHSRLPFYRSSMENQASYRSSMENQASNGRTREVVLISHFRYVPFCFLPSFWGQASPPTSSGRICFFRRCPYFNQQGTIFLQCRAESSPHWFQSLNMSQFIKAALCYVYAMLCNAMYQLYLCRIYQAKL